MMKKICTLLVAICLLQGAQAQFTIKGQLKNYDNKPVVIRVFENGVSHLAQKVETNKDGFFSYTFPKAYKGLINLSLNRGGYQVFADNKDINLSLDVNDPNHSVQYTGGINKEHQEYINYQNYLNIRDKSLAGLMTFYKPEQEFYKALEKESQRISNMPAFEVKNPDLKYYLTIQELIEKNAEQPGAANEEIKSHLVKDGENLENFGFLRDLTSQYLIGASRPAATREQAEQLIAQATDDLLDAVGEDTSRGQSVLLTVINLMQASNFKDLAQKYTDRAAALTCEINPELKALLKGSNNIQVGKTAPNIVFKSPVNGKKSLYDIKADKKLIVFWGSWCGHCQHEMPYLKEFYQEFKKSGGEILAFAVDLQKEDYLPYVKDAGWYNYSDLLKWDSPIVKEFAVDGTPTMILLDKNNKILKIGSRAAQFNEYFK
ncbi:thioredoxin-like domain-containing protein [Ornithobacterium rhinotracheale]